MSEFYAASGGTLEINAPSYITRQADEDLYQHLSKGNYCYVLNSRQTGKSSLLARVAQRLRNERIKVVIFEMTALGNNLSAEQWYDGLITKVAEQLNLYDEMYEYWDNNERLGFLQRWSNVLKEVVLKHVETPMVIILDEVDLVRSLPFSTDEFFAGIRTCFNERTQYPEMARLTFCLAGVATPSELIQDARITPFNIGQRIDLSDFSQQEAELFLQGLKREQTPSKALLKRILYWTNGHPYLTQKLCQAVADDQSVQKPKGVDRICEELFFSSRSKETENNLQHVRTQMLRNDIDHAAILDLYRQIRRQKKIKDDDTNPIINLLRLSGLVKVLENYLWVRNRIYFKVFDDAWIAANLPDAEKQRQKQAQRRGFIQAAMLSSGVIAIMAGLAIWAWFAQQRAEHQENIATQQKDIANQQRDLALKAVNTLTYGNIEKLLNIAGTRQYILPIFEKNIQTLDAIYALEPDQNKAQREKGSNLERIGNMWMMLGDTPKALQAYQKKLEIDQKLTTADPLNSESQRDLSVSFNKLGDVQLRLGQTEQALQAYQKKLEIDQKLTTADPLNSQSQRDLSVSFNNLGNVQLRLGQTEQALQAYQQMNEIFEKLAAADPLNSESQRDLSVSYSKIADVYLKMKQLNEALELNQKSLTIVEKLLEQDPQNQTLKDDIKIKQRRTARIKQQMEESAQEKE